MAFNRHQASFFFLTLLRLDSERSLTASNTVYLYIRTATYKIGIKEKHTILFLFGTIVYHSTSVSLDKLENSAMALELNYAARSDASVGIATTMFRRKLVTQSPNVAA